MDKIAVLIPCYNEEKTVELMSSEKSAIDMMLKKYMELLYLY